MVLYQLSGFCMRHYIGRVYVTVVGAVMQVFLLVYLTLLYSLRDSL